VFDDVWRSTGTEIIRTPVQAPNANAVATSPFARNGSRSTAA
jgi:hypothetical protein